MKVAQVGSTVATVAKSSRVLLSNPGYVYDCRNLSTVSTPFTSASISSTSAHSQFIHCVAPVLTRTSFPNSLKHNPHHLSFVRQFSSSVRPTTCYTWGQPKENQTWMDSVTNFIPFATKSIHVAELKSPDGTPIVKVSFSSKHSAFVTEKGNVYVRGKVKYALGLGEVVEEAHGFTLVNGLPRIVDVCCGKDHTIALSDAGKVFTWGWGGNALTHGFGLLGHGDYVSIPTPKQVQTLDTEKIVQISSGYENCLALTADGRVYSWGNGAHGRLGQGNSNNLLLPKVIDELLDSCIVSIASGGEFSAVVSEKGELFTWGRNEASQLGTGASLVFDAYNTSASPALVSFTNDSTSSVNDKPSVVKIKQAACGHKHIVALTVDGKMFIWGDGKWIQPELVRGDDNEMLKPNRSIEYVAAGKAYSAAIDREGRLWTWGTNKSCMGVKNPGSSAISPSVVNLSEVNNLRVTKVFAGYDSVAVIGAPRKI